MKILKGRGHLCPVSLGLAIFLLGISNSRAVDPVDFLESLKDDPVDQSSSGGDGSSTEYPNGVNVIPGEAELNYPVYSTIPKSSFSCIGRPVGFYADTELRCQVWHICDEERRQQSFLCTNGTVYSQEKRVCDWWYNVNCDHNEVTKNYLQNYDLYKESPAKSENEEENKQNQGKDGNNKNNDYNSNKNINEFDYKPTTKSSSRDQFYNQPRQPSESQRQPQRYNSNNEQYSKPTTTPSYDEPSRRDDSSFSNNNNNFQQSPSRRQPPPPTTQRQTTTTTYRPPTTYATPPPPAALQGSSFPPQRHQSHHQHQQRPQTTTTASPSRAVPSQKTYNSNGKRIVEIRVPISQIPPEILAKYGKRIPEHLLKEIFLNFTRNQQQDLQREAIKDAKPSNPTGAGNNRSPPPKAPVSQPRHSPPPPSSHSQSHKKPVDFGSNDYNKPSFSSPTPKPSYSSPPPKPSYSSPQPKSNSNPPPPPPPPQEPQQKFRHSTPRRVDNVKFATPTRELLADYDDERQLVGESQNPAYSLQQLFSSHHSRTSQKFKESPADNEVPRVKESFTFATTTTTTPYPQQYQEHDPFQQVFTRFPPRRRAQTPGPSTYRSTTTTTTEEPALITDRYVPVATREEKKNADVRRILLVAKQGIQVLPPIPFLSGGSAQQEPLHPTPRRVPPRPTTQRPQGRRTTPFQEFSKIPPVPKVAIPDDYYVKKETFQEAESRYPTPGVPSTYTEPIRQSYQRPTTSTTTTTTTTTTTQPPPPPTPYFQEADFRRTKPSKPQQHKKKALPPPPETKKPDSSSDYDDGDDGSPRENFNTDELELLRLAQEYIELTGQDFGIRQQPKNA